MAFEFRGNVPIDVCHGMMWNYVVNDQGVPDGLVIMKKVSRF